MAHPTSNAAVRFVDDEPEPAQLSSQFTGMVGIVADPKGQGSAIFAFRNKGPVGLQTRESDRAPPYFPRILWTNKELWIRRVRTLGLPGTCSADSPAVGIESEIAVIRNAYDQMDDGPLFMRARLKNGARVIEGPIYSSDPAHL